jgi:hypothetical protein
MGVYDMLPNGSQVKLWNCDMETKEKGDHVSDFGLPEYIVLLREGGFVRVENGVITDIRENTVTKFYPEDFPGIACFDKWGGRVEVHGDLIGEFQGIAGMDDPYYF